MKTLILFLLTMSIGFNIYAQNKLDPIKVLDKTIDTNIVFNSNEFIKGWNWGSPGAKLDSALGINYYHNINLESNNYHYNSRVFFPILHSIWGNWPYPHIMGGRNSNRIFQSNCIRYDPTITVDSTHNFKSKPYDSAGSTFGFYFKNKVRTLNSSQHSNPDYVRIMLDKDSLTSGQNELVLSKVWKSDALRFLNQMSSGQAWYDQLYYCPKLKDTINGRRMFLIINLKSREHIPSNLRDSVVLSIKAPYKFKHETGDGSFTLTYDSLKFRNIPQVTQSIQNDTVHIYGSRGDYRGIQRRTDTSGTNLNIKEWKITAGMLDADGNGTADSNITLKAFFRCDTAIQGLYINNPLLQPEWWQHPDITEYISDLDLEVRFFKPGNGLDLAIGYIMFATPRSTEIFEGKWDTLVQNAAVYTSNRIRQNPSNPKIYRYYGDDEMQPSQWQSNRYFNLLIDTLSATEVYLHDNSSAHFMHAIGCKDLWNGDNVTHYTTTTTAVPYIRQSNADYYKSFMDNSPYFNLWWGFNGNGCKTVSSQLFNDTLQSQYETTIFRNDGKLNFVALPVTGADTNFINNISYSSSYYMLTGIQSVLERYVKMFNDNKDFLYSEKPWYANIWLTGNVFTNDTRDRMYYESWRPKTGEEVRLGINSCLITGARGLIYWLKNSIANTYGNMGSTTMGLQPQMTLFQQNSLPINDTLVYSNQIGGDYIDINGDPFGLDTLFNINNVDLSTMGITSSRLPIMTKSMRAEVYKTHDWINAVESDLMNLRLAAWYGKGFLRQYSQDESKFGTENLLSKFISLDSNDLYTRKIYDPASGSWDNPREAYDSTFMDITLFRTPDQTSDEALKTGWTMGVLNRRTDPLILYTDPLDTTKKYMKFLATAEFDSLCTDSPDSLRWQSYFWKRQGSRLLNIKFNFQFDPNNPENYALLHVSELGCNNQSLNSQPWRDPKYYHKIDTVVGQDRAISIRMQPGEGKLLKVEILPPPKKAANLDFSNQRKLIGHPIFNNGVLYNDSIYYHLVYHREVDGRKMVFYRRSKIVTDTTPLLNYSNIIWEEPEMCLSDSVWVDCEETSWYNPDNCAYPAIVVRPDGNGNNIAYVVFTCDYNLGLSIIENKLQADSPYPVNRDRPKKLMIVNGRNMDNWGTPMINASSDGNFYTWSDSTLGIALAWKGTDSPCLQTSFYTRFDTTGQMPCGHPSLNSYSRQGENECALVWSENNFISQYPPYQSTRKLVYVRPKYNGTNIYLDQFRPMNNVPDITFNSGLTKAAIGNIISSDNMFPVVYRGLEEQSFQDKDRIAWQDMIDNLVPCGPPPLPIFSRTTSINYLMVDTETRQGNDSSFFYPIKYLHAESISPNLANGKFWGGTNNLSDSAMIMEFSTLDPCFPEYKSGRKIWSVPHGYISFLADNSYTITELQAMTHATQLSGNGYMPHLASRPTTDGESGWWKNRRVFMEADNTIGDTLLASAETFYKGAARKIAVPFVGFVNNENTSLISPFMLDGEPIGFDIAENFKLGCDTCLSSRLPETIRTKWFKVGSRAALDLFAKGLDLDNVEMYVERRSNRQTSRINIVSMADTIMAPVNFSLLNGGNNEYRILFKKRNNFNFYTEHLYFMPDPFARMMLKRGEEGMIMVDLGMTGNDNTDNNLTIYPNPAENVLYVTACNGMETKTRLKVRIYTSLSELIQEYEVNSCETASIPTAGMPAGVYFIRAAGRSGSFVKM